MLSYHFKRKTYFLHLLAVFVCMALTMTGCSALLPASDSSGALSEDLPRATALSLADADGNRIISYAPVKDYSSVVISTPALTQGTAYTLYSGGTHSGNATAGLYESGSFSGGTKLFTVTLSSTVTSVSDTGAAVTGDMGGMGGGRGDHQKP